MSHAPYDHISDYIAGTRFAVLTYLRDGATPVARSMGSFAAEGLDLFFSTRREAAKVGERFSADSVYARWLNVTDSVASRKKGRSP